MIKLYHGSTMIINHIDLSFSRPNKDFGKGFYLSSGKSEIYERNNISILFWNRTCHFKITEDMNVTQSEYNYLKDQITARMIQILVEEQGYSIESAVDKVYSSDIYQKLSNPETGLFYQSPRYVMSYL